MSECRSLEEIRSHIDRLDVIIVELLAERAGFVGQAARFKPTEADVVIPERIETIIRKVRGYAIEQGTSPDLIERIYRHLIDACCDFEAANWRRLHGVQQSPK